MQPTVGGIWQNPERKKLSGGSEAYVYVIDGFTVAHVFAPGYVDREKVEKGFDLAIFLPVDEHRSTPKTWVREFDEAEQFIKQQRAAHPDWPTEPVPLLVCIPEFKKASDSRTQVAQIVKVLESRGDFNLHDEDAWTVAVGLYVHCQGRFINQKSIDEAQLLRAVFFDLTVN